MRLLRPRPITSRYVRQYRPVIQNLWRFESEARGEERAALGFTALGLARFLRRCAVGKRDRAKLLALAKQAEEVGRLCVEYDEPRGSS